MSRENNCAPRLRFPGFTGEWEMKRLGEVGSFIRGLSYNNSEVTDDSSNTLIIRSNNIIPDSVVDCNNGLVFVTKSPSKEQILKKGDVVICLANGSSNLVGKTSCFDGDYKGTATVGAFCGIYRSALPICRYLVQTAAYKEKISLIKQGGNGALANLYGKDIMSLEFPFPSPEEQDKIVKCLSLQDELISAQRQNIDALKEEKKGLMQKLFPQKGETTPRLRFSEFNDAWVEHKLGDLCGSIKTGKLDANAMVDSGKYRFYTCSKDYSYIDSYAFDGDCIMIAGNGAHLGYVHHYKGKFNAYQRTYVLEDFSCDSTFLEYCIRRFLPNRILMEKKEGNTPYIVLSTLTDMEIPLPSSLAEQQKIAECLSALDEQISAESAKLESLKDHKKGLMQQLFPQPAK